MKKWVVIFTVLTAAIAVQAQETLVGDGFHSGGYGGPVWKVGSVNGKTGLFAGGRGGWIINHKFVIGGGGYGIITEVETELTSADGKTLFLDMDYGGFEMEYIHNSDKLIHWTFHTMLGSGSVKLVENDPRNHIDDDKMFIIEPSLNVVFNIMSWFRIGVGMSYRAVFGVEMADISSADLGGPSGLIILKFGSF